MKIQPLSIGSDVAHTDYFERLRDIASLRVCVSVLNDHRADEVFGLMHFWREGFTAHQID